MKIHRKIAKAFGYDLIRRRKAPHRGLLPHLLHLINHYEIDLVLDVGANVGQYGKMLRDEGYKGEIHSFEPVSAPYENLRKICMDDSRWFDYKLAMGSACETKTINVLEWTQLSSFHDPIRRREALYNQEIQAKEEVEVGTIDDFLTSKIKNLERRRILLKMDTQGYDLEVFKGALGSLGNIVGIQSEISLIPIYSGMPHYLESLRVFEENGFKVTGMYPVARGKDLSLIEMDVVLINGSEKC